MTRKPIKRKNAKAPRKSPLGQHLAGLAATVAGTLGAYWGLSTLMVTGCGWDPSAACLLSGAGVALGLGPLRRMGAQSLSEWSSGLHLVRQFTDAARSQRDLVAVANLAVSTLQRVFKPHHLFLWLPPAGEPSLHLVAGHGRLPASMVIPEFTMRQLLKGHPDGPWVLEDPGAKPPEAFDQLMLQVGAHVCVPLTLHGQLLGLVTLGKRRTGRAYDAREIGLIARFGAAIAAAVAPHQLRAEQALHLSKLEAVSRLYVDAQKKAVTDGLTGLTTHMHFQEQLAKRFYESRRYDQPISLLFIDIDHFKRINDTYGHLTGDEVLRTVAQTVQETARSCDTVARYGGEELAMLLPQTDLEGAYILAERLCEAVKALQVQEASGPRMVSVTVSIGVAQLQADDMTPASLLDRADRAVYEAKHRGRNQVMLSA
ncbi:MAG TPA: sensor domain-containing diguanylate cyclase [Stenomitos sp.]